MPPIRYLHFFYTIKIIFQKLKVIFDCIDISSVDIHTLSHGRISIHLKPCIPSIKELKITKNKNNSIWKLKLNFLKSS